MNTPRATINPVLSLRVPAPVRETSARREELVRVVIDGEEKWLTRRMAIELSEQLLRAAFDSANITHRVIEATCHLFEVSLGELFGDRGMQRVADARFAAMFVMCEICGVMRKDAGLALNRDHSAITHGVRRAEVLRQTDPKFKAALEQLISKFK